MSNIPQPNSRTPLLASHHASTSRARSPANRPAQADRSPSRAFIRRRSRSPPVHILPAIVTSALLAFVAFIVWDVSSFGNCYFAPLCRILGDGQGRLDEVWWSNSGAYAPYRSLGAGGGKRNLPKGCKINQVTVLHRHASRYPTSGAAECIKQSLDKLANRANRLPPRHHTELAFLSRADFNMTGWKLDQLTDQGRKAAWRSGRELAALYHHFLEESDGLFSRSSGQERVEETAGYWLEGFYEEPFKFKPRADLPVANVTIPEGETSNNTLSVHDCPAFEKGPFAEFSELLDLLTPARDRLNSLLQPRPLLETSDLPCLADMCAYDTQSGSLHWEGWSRWCEIFWREEWEILGHYRDLKRYYDIGQGSRLGKTMGAGWVNELVARLTDSNVTDSTTVNHTIDDDEATFVRGGKHFFVDFGHDNEMMAVVTALGVLKQQRDLSVDSVPPKRTYVISKIIPFGARFVFERIGCDLAEWEPDPEGDGGSGSGGGDNDGSGGDGRKNYLRILINDELHTVNHIACKQSGFMEHGMCEVELFLESQSWSQSEADWGVCLEHPEGVGQQAVLGNI